MIMIKTITKTEIQENIEDILKTRLQKKLDSSEPLTDKNLFGYVIGLNAREMVYLVYILEKEYPVTFTPEDMEEAGFYTLGGLAECVARKMGAAGD